MLRVTELEPRTPHQPVALSVERSRLYKRGCPPGRYPKLGAYSILRKENRDGVKFFLDAPKHGNGADAWVLFRASGTENMLRCYVEAATPELVEEILESGERSVRQA